MSEFVDEQNGVHNHMRVLGSSIQCFEEYIDCYECIVNINVWQSVRGCEDDTLSFSIQVKRLIDYLLYRGNCFSFNYNLNAEYFAKKKSRRVESDSQSRESVV